MMCTYKLHSVKDLEPGDHLCCLYENEEEHRTLLTPFLRQGLEKRQKVLYIVDTHTAETVLNYLRDDRLEVESYLTRGQLIISTVGDAYMQDEVFDPERMISLLRTEMERALMEGYSALRVTGEMTWVIRGLPGSERLVEYEAKLNKFLPNSRCLAICQYDRRRFSSKVLLDVLSTHPIAIVGTEVYDNFYYIPPEDFLSNDLPTVTLCRWLGNLAGRKRVEEDREKLILQLQDALTKIKTLRGLLPICASCKKIRDDKGYWQQIEVYIQDHSEAELSHGICPECMKKLYPDL